MRVVLGVLLVAAAAVALAWWLAGLPGTVSLTLAGLTVETSSAIALVALVVLIIVVVLWFQLLAWLLGTGDRVGFWRNRRRRNRGDAAVTAALVGLAAGDADRAERESRRALKLLGETPQALLLRAQAARLAGDETTAAALYRQLAGREDSALLGWRGLFRQAMAREDFAEAAALAGRAEAANPGAPWAREERARLAVRTGDWRGALALSAPDAPRAAFAVAAADAASDPAEGTRLARDALRAHPAFAPAALAYARRLRETGKDARAQDVLRDAWTAAPQPDLAALALASGADAPDRLRQATRLVSGRAGDAESHLLLGRVALEAGDLAAARRHVEAVRKAGLDQRRLWVLLADLEAREGVDPAATLRRAATAPADPAWRCDSCGTQLPQWAPVCPQCNTAGRVDWRQPARSALVTTAG